MLATLRIFFLIFFAGFFDVFFGRRRPADLDEPNTVHPLPALYKVYDEGDKIFAYAIAFWIDNSRLEMSSLSASDYTILETLEVQGHGSLSDSDAINVYVVGWELCEARARRNWGKVRSGRAVKNPQAEELRSLLDIGQVNDDERRQFFDELWAPESVAWMRRILQLSERAQRRRRPGTTESEAVE